jgi:hypothetical protein
MAAFNRVCLGLTGVLLILSGCSPNEPTCSGQPTPEELADARALVDAALRDDPIIPAAKFNAAYDFVQAARCEGVLRLTYGPKEGWVGGAQIFEVDLRRNRVDLIYSED